uniref:Radical SAM protein n=1 Tax=Macrostomum lignano TaxID=282301 RepID=A0A1I8J2K9_9PLAT
MDSRDSRGRERFHPVPPGNLLEDGRMPAWLRNASYYRPVRACLSCPSPESVTFFDVTEFHKTDALIRHMGPALLPYKTTV